MSEFLAKRITMRFIRKFQIKEEDWDLYYLGIEVIVTTALTSLMIMALGIALRNFFGSVVFQVRDRSAEVLHFQVHPGLESD